MADPLPAMGLDESINPTPSEPILGLVEYVFKVSTSAPLAKEGVMIPTDASHSTPTISFIGERGESPTIPISYGLKAGNHSEFATVSRDVGRLKAIRLANVDNHGDSWVPSTVSVNRIGASSSSLPSSKPDGWISFKVGRAVHRPEIFQKTTEASGNEQQVDAPSVFKS